MAMKRFWLSVAGVLTALTVALEVVYRDASHAYFWWQAVPMFDLIYGLVGCVVIVLVSKWLGHAWLQRAETYYGDEQ
jgi:hypothetical protein